MEVEHELHLRKADLIKTSIKNDTEEAKNDPSMYAFIFDLVNDFAFLKFSKFVVYYKRNVYGYNCEYYELSAGLGFI